MIAMSMHSFGSPLRSKYSCGATARTERSRMSSSAGFTRWRIEVCTSPSLSRRVISTSTSRLGKGTRNVASKLVGYEPLLKEARKRRAIERRAAFGIDHAHLAVASDGDGVEVDAAARPTVEFGRFVEGDHLRLGVAREDVVQTQRLVVEMVVEALRRDGSRRQDAESDGRKSLFHIVFCCLSSFLSAGAGSNLYPMPFTVTMRSSPIFWRNLRMCTSMVRSPTTTLSPHIRE